jgi:type IV secretory pathway TrbF-like protein
MSKQSNDTNKVFEKAQTPYDRAKAEWAGLLGTATIQAKNWRLIALIESVIIILVLLILMAVASKSSVTTFIVETDKIGKVSAIEKLGKTHIPNENNMKYFLGKFIKKSRSIPSDPVVLKEQWKSVYSFMTRNARNKMTQYASELDPVELMASMSISVDIVSVTAMSHDAYQVQWVEKQYSTEGILEGEQRYNAILTTQLHAPKTEEEIFVNPLGIYVSDFNWNKVL